MLVARAQVRVACYAGGDADADAWWAYGRVSKVHAGRELLDVSFDDGETASNVPAWDVHAAVVSAADGDAEA